MLAVSLISPELSPITVTYTKTEDWYRVTLVLKGRAPLQNFTLHDIIHTRLEEEDAPERKLLSPSVKVQICLLAVVVLGFCAWIRWRGSFFTPANSEKRE